MSQKANAAATKRYAVLRAALRAASPDPETLEASGIERRFAELRAMLQSSANEPDAKAHIDAALSELTTELVATIKGLSFWQFRATLPTVAEQSPRELEALLDTCLTDPNERWCDLVDYIITLLAATQTDGNKRLERDPCTLVPRIAKICRLAAKAAGTESAGLEAQLRDAQRQLESNEPLRDVVTRIRELKRNAGDRMFVPGILAAAIEFNVAVFNRTTASQQAQRSLHEAELDVLSEANQSPSGNGTDHHALPAYGSFELGAVEGAITERIRGVPMTSADSQISRIASRLDVSKLSAVELDAFGEGAGSPVSDTIRAVVTIGLAVRHIADIESELERLDVDSDWLLNSAAQEIDGRAGAGIRELMRIGQFERAQSLAELRSIYLKPRPNTAPPETSDSSAPTQRPGRIRTSTSSVPPPPLRKTVQSPPKRAKAPTESSRKTGLWIAMAAAGVCAVTVAFISIDRDPEDIGVRYSNEQLYEISPHLTRGFRVDTEFIGTVNAMWSRLDPDERRTKAGEIGESMAKEGITTVSFLDLNKREKFRFENGSLVHFE